MSDSREGGGAVVVSEMTCQEFVELVTDYLEDSLAPANRYRFEQHLIDCPDCPFYLSQMQNIISAVGTLRPIDVAPAARAALMSRFRSWKSGI